MTSSRRGIQNPRRLQDMANAAETYKRTALGTNDKPEHRVYTIDEINSRAKGRVLRLPRIVSGTTIFATIIYGSFIVLPIVSAVILASLLHPHTIFECAYTLFYMLACALGLYMAVFFMFGVLINCSSKKGD